MNWDWKVHHADLLHSLPERRLGYLDIDLTFTFPDTNKLGTSHFGARFPGSTSTMWEKIDEEFSSPGSGVTMGQLIEHALRECIQGAGGVEKFVEWMLEGRHHLVPGGREFLDILRRLRIAPVAATNGCVQVASRLLAHHGIEMPLVGNSITVSDRGGIQLNCFHGHEHGVDKGLLVEHADQLGFEVAICCGDSIGDITMARETALRGGIILARRGLGLAQYCEATVRPEQWRPYTDFTDRGVLEWVEERLSLAG